MNITFYKQKVLKFWYYLIIFTVVIAYITCTSDSKISGTVDTTDTGISKAIIYNPDLTPAVGAIVKLFQANDTSKVAVKQVITDKNGSYTFKDISSGHYNLYAEKGNLVAYQDSVTVLDDTVLINNDTLESARKITAIVGMQPNHNPMGVTVQILGSELYVNVNDDDGFFTFDKLAKGTYRLKLETNYEGYTTTYKTITISQATPDTLSDTLWMIYTGIPVVKGITSFYDTLEGLVKLKWNRTTYKDLQEYLIFRDPADGLVLSTVPILLTIDTQYVDTIYRKTAVTGQKSFSDTSSYQYKYRVAIRNNSQQTGISYRYNLVKAVPPSLVKTAIVLSKKHKKLNIFSSTATKNDSIQYIVIGSNPTRKLKTVSWRDLEKNVVIKQKTMDSIDVKLIDTLMYSWGTTGTKTLECSILDEAGTLWKDSVDITIIQDTPKVVLTTTTPVVGINDTIKLQSTVASTYGSIVKKEWKIGSTDKWIVCGNNDTAIIAPAKENPSYIISLRVTDDDGNVNGAEVPIKVETMAPIAFAGSDTTVFVSETIKLHGIGTDESAIVEYAWKIGDGEWVLINSGDISFSGSLTAKTTVCSLRVKDDEGNYGYDQQITRTIGHTLTDIDGNSYDVIRIGSQFWTSQNLRVTKFNDGTAINYQEYNNQLRIDIPKCLYYGYSTDLTFRKTYGLLYNWHVIQTGKLAPKGWHVPSDAEWDTLQNYLSNSGYNFDGTNAGNKIAQSLVANKDWKEDTTLTGVPGNNGINIHNKSGFSALPGGFVHSWGEYGHEFTNLLSGSYFWSSTTYAAHMIYGRYITFNAMGLYQCGYGETQLLSIRLVSD
jgi:uncharacterized protein (TIGR02145 family)